MAMFGVFETMGFGIRMYVVFLLAHCGYTELVDVFY
jgi:hypothetical protein